MKVSTRGDYASRALLSLALHAESDGLYIAKVAKPPQGWTAFFVELVYDSGEKVPYKFSTQVSIVPDVLPHHIDEYQPPRAPSSLVITRTAASRDNGGAFC